MAENNNPMDLLNSLLSNPDALRTVGKMISNSAAGTPSPMPGGDLPKTDVPSVTDSLSAEMPDLSRIMRAEDNGTRLLHALEPYLSQKRRGSVEQIVQAVKMGKVISAMSKGKF